MRKGERRLPMNSFSAKTDAELVAMASHDDQEAFACLLGRYNAVIHAKAIAVSEHCGCDVTDDMAQEAAIGFLNAVRTYDPAKGASFRTYAGRCIDNVLTSAIRSYFSEKNTVFRGHSQLDDPGMSKKASLAESDDTAGYVIFGESESAVLSELSELERSVIQMRLRGMSYEETAQALGISVKSVDNAIQRVRQKFKSSMQYKR